MQATPSEAAPRTLIADDQPDVLEALRLLLKGEGYQTELAGSPGAVIDKLRARPFDLLLMDLNYARDTTSGQEGLDLLRRVQSIDSTLPIVAMTAWGSVPLAVEAMRQGVRDFVEKPWENARLLSTIETQIEWARGERRRKLKEEIELEDAREVERRLLPGAIPQIEGCEIACAWQPAGSVGGDYFDVLKFSERRAGLCIADVMGKGFPAALVMSNLQAAVRATGSENLPPRQIAAQLNRIVSSNLAAGKFITLFYALADTGSNRMIYSNAGHNAPILMRQDGSHVRLEQGGAALGVVASGQYDQAEINLCRGDRLLLFTDGITEAINAQGDEFGEDRLIDILRSNRAAGATQLEKIIMDEVNDFSGGNLNDDSTMIVLSMD